MVRLVIGKAGSGKTGKIISEIAENVKNKRGRSLLIVPEQYSHEAERELCTACGDTMSRYAEVLSFTGLAREILTRQGRLAVPFLDNGGKMLCMSLAIENLGPRLKYYAGTRSRSQLQLTILKAIDELKTASISSPEIRNAAMSCDRGLRDKLEDIALIMEAYDAVVASGYADPTDLLSELAKTIPDSDLDENTSFYVDGFTDFTAQEIDVLKAAIGAGVHVTVCLTLDRMFSENEVFGVAARTAAVLSEYAREKGTECRVDAEEGAGKNPDIRYLADHLFVYSRDTEKEQTDCIRLVQTDSMSEECEFAAAECLRLVREEHCRWRDIAIAVRGFDDYRTSLENSFERYGVPLFLTAKSDISAKPIPALISGAYELIDGGWEVDDLIAYLHTGLTGLTVEECDLLENYVFLWQLKAAAWKRPEPWGQHPDGFGAEATEETKARLEKINLLRKKISEPIFALERAGRHGRKAMDQIRALTDFFAAISLPERLEQRAKELEYFGEKEKAAEYSQLWEIIVSALEQSAAILNDMELGLREFSQLFMTVLSQYSVGTIPISLDSVSAGDFDRMRRRNIRHLILLGATDSRIPKAAGEPGVFNDADRERLRELNVDLGGADDTELWREFTILYNTITLPSHSLTVCRPNVDGDGNPQHLSILTSRAKKLFVLEEETIDMEDVRMSAKGPAMELAAHAAFAPSKATCAAEAYFREKEGERFEQLKAAADLQRGNLSGAVVNALYGKRIKLSASKIDTLASCKFEYFCRYGMGAKKYEPAGFKPPEIGTFIHAVLEKTAGDVKKAGGWNRVTDDELKEMTERHIEEYIREEMNGFEEKTARFRYLFERMRRDVLQIILDMAVELRRSDFEPIEFEFNFGKEKNIRPIELGDDEGAMVLTGIADRIDGWMHDGNLYLRVVDYKTGKKEFSLADVWYGAGLQMLLYLFTLEENAERFGVERVVPAGVMYVPARDEILNEKSDLDESEIERKRRDKLRRSGIVLNSEEVFDAWEHGVGKEFIPVKFDSKGAPKAGAIASTEQFGLLYRHIVGTLTEMAKELHEGDIQANPLFRDGKDNACSKCDYASVCNFKDGENGESCRRKIAYKPDEIWTMMEEETENGSI